MYRSTLETIKIDRQTEEDERISWRKSRREEEKKRRRKLGMAEINREEG
jgi:hypothetical protein